MDYRFLAEIIERKPQLFKAVLSFNKPFAAALPPELAELGEPWADSGAARNFAAPGLCPISLCRATGIFTRNPAEWR